MHIREGPEAVRNFFSNVYHTVRHYAGRADDAMLASAAVYKAATPLVAAGMDAYASPETKRQAMGAKKAIDRGLVRYAKARKVGRAAGRIGDVVMS